MAADRPSYPPAYRALVLISTPIMTLWSRLEVSGLDRLPATGPVLIVADHDSYWDPLAIAVAARKVRSIRALAKASLWSNKIAAAVMDSMGHIPVDRGAGNDAAMATAVEKLRAGACIGIFPEGTRSLGRPLRARSGVGRLAEAVPEAEVVCVRTTGSVDVVRAPRRPSVTVEFFRPSGGQLQPGETPTQFAQRLVSELRESAPYEIPGRRRTAAKFRARLGSPAG